MSKLGVTGVNKVVTKSSPVHIARTDSELARITFALAVRLFMAEGPAK